MRSTFFRQLLLITVLLLLSLSVLGGVFQLGMRTYAAGQQQKALSGNAAAVADMARAYSSAGDLAASWDFRMSLSLITRIAEADAVVCDTEGRILVCSCEEFFCRHPGRYVPQRLVTAALENGSYYFTGTLPDLYEDGRYVQALGLTSHNDRVLGVVLVSSSAAEMVQSLRGMFRVFLYTAAGVWLLAVAVTFVISRREARPLKEMVKTVGRFSHGDFSARANIGKHNASEVTELATAFNSMAESLEASDRRRSEFVANVSHELKTPMTSIAGYLDGMLDGTIEQSAHRQYMTLVRDEVRRLSRLVKNMLEISRMQSGGIAESKLSRFDLGEAVGRILVTFEQKIRARHLEVDVEFPEKPIYTKADADSIAQVVYNLVDNAVKFANDGGDLALSVRQEGAKAYVTVKNTGPVIPAAELSLIFERFHKLDKSRSMDPGGVGLGLYIVKTIIGAHGQEIWVESHDGETAFTFTLPVVK